mgnify:CR=1 FL=1
MKVFRFFLFASALVLAACVKEPVFEDPAVEAQDGRIPLNIYGSINQVPTKATAQGFVDKDAVGLFAVNYTSGNTVPGVLAASGNQADNAKYIFDESAHKWDPVRPVYYKDVNTNVDLYLYYPYFQNITDADAFGFEVEKDQSTEATDAKLSGYEASDWMWGKATGVTPTELSITVPLQHKMAAVQVVLNRGTGFADGEFESLEKNVIVTNTTRKATLSFADGSVTPIGSPQADGIVMCLQSDGSFRAIVVPQTVTAGTKLFAITIDGISYNFSQNVNVNYQAGKQAVMNININKKTPTGDYSFTLGSFTITDWTEDLNTHGGTARQYYVVNVTEPGTLGSLIEADGKNPAKIRNLKVTGTVTTEDFYFMRDNMDILEAVNMKECRVVHARMIINDDSWTTEDDVIPYQAFYGKSTLYYFTFPEKIKKICRDAFSSTPLSGPLYVPEDCEAIGRSAFFYTNITNLVFGNKLEIIGDDAFRGCSSISGALLLPDSLKEIGDGAFRNTYNLSGPLRLPESLVKIGGQAFSFSGNFTGDLIIPTNISELYGATFSNSSFTGSLVLNNVSSFGTDEFYGCQLTGELILPENLLTVPEGCFRDNRFTRIILPNSIKSIEHDAFYGNGAILGPVVIPEDCVIIKVGAFMWCNNIPSVEFPERLQTIQSDAFKHCYGITKMISHAIEPPTVFSGAFNGVGKDNLTLEVPGQSLIRYQTESGWSDFKRISAYQDFSVSRREIRTLNAATTNKYVLRAPSDLGWSIESKPDWVTISPSSGTGKAEISITVSAMEHSDATFSPEVWVNGYYDHTNTYKGRMGDIVFLLDDKDYRFTMSVEQYDHDYSDGEVQTLQTASKGSGIDIILMGDCYDAQDIATGKYLQDMTDAYNAFFAVEPYATYKDYFNVNVVYAMSKESGIGTVNTIKDSKFGSTLSERIMFSKHDDVFTYAKNKAGINLAQSLVILVVNTSVYEGVTYMYGDGSAIALCPKSTVAYPYDFRGIVQHEAGGHGFGKLADEYIYHNAFITDCSCVCCDHGKIFNEYKARGWYKNLEFTGDMNQVSWSHLIFHPIYSDKVDVYEGGYMHNRGVFRSEPASCMNNNIPYFSSISRQAIVERILTYSGEVFTMEKFYNSDKFTVGASNVPMRSRSKYENVGQTIHGHDHGPVYMGEHPNVK